MGIISTIWRNDSEGHENDYQKEERFIQNLNTYLVYQSLPYPSNR